MPPRFSNPPAPSAPELPMQGEVDTEVSEVFRKLASGDTQASSKLLALLYSELHLIAKGFMAHQPPEHTLQATALVHEAYLKLLSCKETSWRSRAHFLALASRAMRCVLVDHARARLADKRRHPGARLALDKIVVSYQERALDLLALDAALERLAEFDEPMARAVEMRFFGGLEIEEIARFLEMSPRTFDRHWSTTRAWLLKEVL